MEVVSGSGGGGALAYEFFLILICSPTESNHLPLCQVTLIPLSPLPMGF